MLFLPIARHIFWHGIRAAGVQSMQRRSAPHAKALVRKQALSNATLQEILSVLNVELLLLHIIDMCSELELLLLHIIDMCSEWRTFAGGRFCCPVQSGLNSRIFN